MLVVELPEDELWLDDELLLEVEGETTVCVD